MFIVEGFLRCILSETVSDSQKKRINDPENSTLLKIAACIPAIGLVIGRMQSDSLQKKLKELDLPEELRPKFDDPDLPEELRYDPKIDGNILDESATPEVKKTACERAIQLMSIDRDYTKAALVNNILTIAIAIYGVAINVFPYIAGVPFIAGFTLTAATFAFVLCSDRSIERYEKISAKFDNANL